MLFGKRDDNGRAEAVRRVKDWGATYARAAEDETIMVTELQCPEEGCPPIETVLALLRPRQEPRKWKVHKPVVDVTEDDVRAAIDGRHDHSGH